MQFASYEQVVGSQVSRDIQQYDVIKSNFVRNDPIVDPLAVKKNTLVKIIVRRGRITVALRDAKALEDGRAGEQIAVLNPSTKERIRATVINSAMVEIR